MGIESIIQGFATIIVSGEGFGVSVKSGVADHQVTIELFGQRIDLESLVIDANGFFTSSFPAKTTAEIREKSPYPVTKLFTQGEHPGLLYLMTKELPL